MNALEQLTAADPLRGRAPTMEEAARMDAAMRRLVAAEAVGAGGEAGRASGGVARRRRGEPQRGRRPLGGAAVAGPIRIGRRWAFLPAAAAALYAAFALGAPEDGPRRLAPTPASAATVLSDLSRKVATAPVQTGRYAYEKRLSFVSHMRSKPGGKGTFVVVLPHEDEQWIADDGTGVVRNVIRDDKPSFPTPEDRADYDASPAGPPYPDQPFAVEDMTVAGMPAVQVRALPTDPARLRARIEGGDVTLTAMVGQLLSSALTPPDVKVALFAVLKQLPGATLRPGVSDPRGRTGVGVEFDTPAWKTLFLFDPRTGALLGTRSIGRKEVPGREIDDWSLVIESGRRDDAPKPSATRTLTTKVA